MAECSVSRAVGCETGLIHSGRSAVWKAGRSATTRCIGPEVDSAHELDGYVFESDRRASRATQPFGWVGDLWVGPEGVLDEVDAPQQLDEQMLQQQQKLQQQLQE